MVILPGSVSVADLICFTQAALAFAVVKSAVLSGSIADAGSDSGAAAVWLGAVVPVGAEGAVGPSGAVPADDDAHPVSSRAAVTAAAGRALFTARPASPAPAAGL